MNPLLRVVASFAAGAAFMYYLDPVAGRRRRSLVRDQAVAVQHDAERLVRAKSKRAADHMQGALARTRARISPRPVDDDQLRERIRAKLGHVIDRPSAIEVEVHSGQVVLRGDVLNGEMETAVETIAKMHGVRGIVTHLSPRASADTPSVAREARPIGTQEAQSRKEVQH